MSNMRLPEGGRSGRLFQSLVRITKGARKMTSRKRLPAKYRNSAGTTDTETLRSGDGIEGSAFGGAFPSLSVDTVLQNTIFKA